MPNPLFLTLSAYFLTPDLLHNYSPVLKIGQPFAYFCTLSMQRAFFFFFLVFTTKNPGAALESGPHWLVVFEVSLLKLFRGWCCVSTELIVIIVIVISN